MPFSVVSFVPLGTPLMDTVVEVRDEHGRIVAEGEGQLFIGETDLIDTQHTSKSYFKGTKST